MLRFLNPKKLFRFGTEATKDVVQIVQLFRAIVCQGLVHMEDKLLLPIKPMHASN